ncbi:MAG: fumarylacetoacetate hydrolase family protein [Rhizobiaceae bacterium]|nr:fumarylacetoacetate hydrolase family protein [Rhizobiaceae bacterium]
MSVMRPRLVAFTAGGKSRYGLYRDDGVTDLSPHYGKQWPTLREAIEAGALMKLAEEGQRIAPEFAHDEIAHAIPVPAPEKIICVGVNFPDRNEEYKDAQAAATNPSLFVRFPRSFVGHGQPILRPFVSPQFDYEGEIVIVIGKAGRHIAERDALSHIAAISLANEGSVRDWLRHAKFNVTQGKNFDASGSIGPWLIPFEGEAQIADIQLQTRVNGEVRQNDRTSRMTYSFRKLIAYISTFATLVPGDVILTGTPTGAGARFDPPKWLVPGDVVEVEADGIGLLSNAVADEPR